VRESRLAASGAQEFYRVLGVFYIYLWVKRSRVRYWLERSARVVLTVSLLLLILEVALEIVGRHFARDPSIVVQGIFFLFVFVALFTKLREWSDKEQERYFIEAAGAIVRELSKDLATLTLDDGIYDLLAIFRKTFERRGDINVNVATHRTDGRLEVTYCYPVNINYDPALSFGPGEGGAGYCCQERCAVYIPVKSFRHAILRDIERDATYDGKLDLFVPDEREPFRSILSVPIVTGGECFGVLNFDSTKRNAFRRVDFEQASFYGYVMAQFLQGKGQRSHGLGGWLATDRTVGGQGAA
jgi:GAF domain-containing protein